MEWVKRILEQYTDEEGKLDLDAANAAIDKEFPKQAIVKSRYNEKAEEARKAKEQLDALEEGSADLEDLRKQLQAAQSELASVKTRSTIEAALRKEGASDEDLDYLVYKLEKTGLETGEDGTIKDLDTKVGELKTSLAKFFSASADNEDEDDEKADPTPPGYEIDDNNLEKGKAPDPEAAMVAELERAMGLSQPEPTTPA